MMRLTQSEILKTRVDAIASPRAQDLCKQGFTIEEVERAVCVACGYIDGDFLRPFPNDNKDPAVMSGRYVLHKNGVDYDAGHLCEKCIQSKPPKHGSDKEAPHE